MLTKRGSIKVIVVTLKLLLFRYKIEIQNSITKLLRHLRND